MNPNIVTPEKYQENPYLYLDENFDSKEVHGSGSGGSKGNNRNPHQGKKTRNAIKNENTEQGRENRIQSAKETVKSVVTKLLESKKSALNTLDDYISWVNLCIENKEIYMEENDIKFETSKSGGAGGQNVNKVESRARARHIITGIFSESGQERDQPKNKVLAVESLASKLQQHLNAWKTILTDANSENSARKLTLEELENYK